MWVFIVYVGGVCMGLHETFSVVGGDVVAARTCRQMPWDAFEIFFAVHTSSQRLSFLGCCTDTQAVPSRDGRSSAHLVVRGAGFGPRNEEEGVAIYRTSGG